MFEKLSKPKFIGIVIVISSVLGPIIINFLYSIGNETPIFITMWNAAETLEYFGTLLGATATIAAVVITINYANKSNEVNRIHSEKVNHRNIGIPICIELIDNCNPVIVFEIIEELQRKDDKNNNEENCLKTTEKNLIRFLKM
ncbi:hypothetical protein [Acetobacterium sp.]|uniref:hypothetical protein n=1 Tax=Acetobacterium sp. TaxID=1872094 RepID=UPI002722F5A6|nr:hypothetical protein [Acetobacterium sp.]MDO9491411.1 hypothetical protein [Acetobacterium sp.]